MQDLDRKGPADLDVLRAVHRAHRAFAEALLDAVSIREDLADDVIERSALGCLARHQNLPNHDAEAPPPGAGSTITCDSRADVMYITTVATAPPSATANDTSAISAASRIASRSLCVHT